MLKTLIRLLGKINILKSASWIPLLMEGIKDELEKVNDYKKIVLSSVIPNTEMDADTIDDNIQKYGLGFLNLLPSITDDEKIDYLIEAASLSGYPGPEWLEGQLAKAGFTFYTFALPSGTDPADVDGELIVGTHPTGGSYSHATDSSLWPFYFVLSPSSSGIVDYDDMADISAAEYEVLRNIIINSKFQRSWCILQVKYSAWLDGTRKLDGTWYLDGLATEVS